MKKIAILGGGPAGLATGWSLEMIGRDYDIWESALTHGGNARTIRFNDFLYDTGPHRFHDRDPVATKYVTKLLGADIHEVNAPSQIYYKGRFINFPLRPLETLISGDVPYALRAGRDLLVSRLKKRDSAAITDFASYASYWFGETIAQTFLIPFSEKLWGLPATSLSPDISGRRLPGFSFKTIFKDVFLTSRRVQHLEGRFLYPRLGYGQIADKMADCLAAGRLNYSCRVFSIETQGDKISNVGIQNREGNTWIAPSVVVNTLPITIFVKMMNPQPPQEVITMASKLYFRDVILVFLCVEQESISKAAVTYFPEPHFKFTRIHEPRNRSRAMSPLGKTSLVIEFPCFRDDQLWCQDEHTLVEDLIKTLDQLGLIQASQVIASSVNRIVNAYPVYSKDYKEMSQVLLAYLRHFRNLRTLGRGGSFFYGHVNDFITDGFSTAKSVDTYLKLETKFSH